MYVGGWVGEWLLKLRKRLSTLPLQTCQHYNHSKNISRQKAAGVALALVGAVLIALNAPSPLPPTGGGLLPEEQIYHSLITWRACIYTILVFVVAFCVVCM